MRESDQQSQQINCGLYRPAFEHENCGFGLFAQLDGRPSHFLIETVLHALTRLAHRGAIAADGKTGDGCGLLFALPKNFLQAVAKQAGLRLGRNFAVGMVFLDRDQERADQGRRCLQDCLAEQGLESAGWRVVPTDASACGEEAFRSCPRIEQIFVHLPAQESAADSDLRLYKVRRRAERLLADQEHFYISSLSSRLISYKGLVMPRQLPVFYPDLKDERLCSSLSVFHQRFSTNTWPRWRFAQPFRHLAHNGEINTIQGNRGWARARFPKFRSPRFPDLAELMPIVNACDSDSCSVDHMLEFLLMGGLDMLSAMRLMIPPAWQHMDRLDPELRDCYRRNSLQMEPWDGPAGIVCTDGQIGACILDRNGLRPARYVLTRDRYLTVGSEIGIYDYAPADVLTKGRLAPGEMIAVDIESKKVLLPENVNDRLKHSRPPWHRRPLRIQRLEAALTSVPEIAPERLPIYRKMFMLTDEEYEQVLWVLAEQGQEAVGSMGDDTPLPVLSRQVRSLYDSFRQQFAQVTNPSIDSLRERIVMSLDVCLGPELELFTEEPRARLRVALDSPVLSGAQFHALLDLHTQGLPHQRIELCYDPRQTTLREAIEDVAEQAVRAVRDGHALLLLSDRNVAKDTIPAHALLATAAVHHRLVRENLRCDANILVESASARDPHHFGVLIGCGASVVYPYLAYEVLHDEARRSGDAAAELCLAYRLGIEKGLYKIMSKMGISAIASYRGAQLFEIVGLHDEVVDLCFTGTVSRIQGLTFTQLEQDQQTLAREAWDARKPVRHGGLLKFVYGGEFHAFNPDVVQKLHQAVELSDYSKYQEFSEAVNQRQVMVLRDLLSLRNGAEPVPLEQVESVEQILTRFDSAGMSLGALSPTAHESLAQAMNALGGRSNSGEGGEARERYGTDRNSRIKQVASGRFGVTAHYLVNADVLQIKIAQGAKPGEGGQLPGHKVNTMIAALRHSKPGVTLISPPPHHDVYSIEDLAQLIFDLKQVNPQALVSVKLVAMAGVGTIAAGVAKAYADLITIAGYDGGTGASPLTSVKYAGCPWELGLSEAQQVLRMNRLRGRVRLQADGGMKTGLDVLKAAILGAESFGFGTAPMVALGCKYLRICHLNNCATGVATQDARLYKKHFKPDGARKVMRYFRFVAEEVRQLMASLGVRRMEDLIGRTEFLEVLPGQTDKQRNLDLMPILSQAGVDDGDPRHCIEPRNAPFDKGELAERMVADAIDVIEQRRGGAFHYRIKNYHRSIGARLSGEIARRYGNHGMADKPLRVRLQGTAGQSFGAWNVGGLDLYLEGDANDYVGKGMAGGRLVVVPPPGSRFRSEETVLMGNACLYGATGGRLYAAGIAGERFAVRNSGACAVVEGAGDHGCEYMTGGVVAVLGKTGANFGAGMTGGVAFVLDRERSFSSCYNAESVEACALSVDSLQGCQDFLRTLIEEHCRETNSAWGAELYQNFSELAGRFWLLKPIGAELASLLDELKAAA